MARVLSETPWFRERRSLARSTPPARRRAGLPELSVGGSIGPWGVMRISYYRHYRNPWPGPGKGQVSARKCGFL